MLDINLIREHPEIVKKSLEKRGDQSKIDWVNEVRVLDADWKNLHQQVDELRHLRNKLSQQVSELKKQKKDVVDLLSQAKEIPKFVEEKEAKKKELKEK